MTVAKTRKVEGGIADVGGGGRRGCTWPAAHLARTITGTNEKVVDVLVCRHLLDTTIVKLFQNTLGLS